MLVLFLYANNFSSIILGVLICSMEYRSRVFTTKRSRSLMRATVTALLPVRRYFSTNSGQYCHSGVSPGFTSLLNSSSRGVSNNCFNFSSNM